MGELQNYDQFRSELEADEAFKGEQKAMQECLDLLTDEDLEYIMEIYSNTDFLNTPPIHFTILAMASSMANREIYARYKSRKEIQKQEDKESQRSSG